MTQSSSLPVAIIGAGVAGLACANALGARNIQTVLFDKGRGPGGRLSTRRLDGPDGPIAFDHGAQFFTARDQGFVGVIETLQSQGFVGQLDSSRLGILDDGGWRLDHRDEPLYVGTPGMNGLVRGLAQARIVHWGSRVLGLSGEPAARLLRLENGDTAGPFSAVVIAVPAEQVADLAQADAPSLAQQASVAGSAPCWAVMGVCDGPPDLPADSVTIKRKDSPIAWASQEDARPERTGPARFVLHASAAWSKAHLEDDATSVALTLSEAFYALTGVRLLALIAHRWRFALVDRSATSPFYWDGDSRIGACGDWRIGPRIELAWLSGDGLGRALAPFF